MRWLPRQSIPHSVPAINTIASQREPTRARVVQSQHVRTDSGDIFLLSDALVAQQPRSKAALSSFFVILNLASER